MIPAVTPEFAGFSAAIQLSAAHGQRQMRSDNQLSVALNSSVTLWPVTVVS
jgi:hypothetical protein